MVISDTQAVIIVDITWDELEAINRNQSRATVAVANILMVGLDSVSGCQTLMTLIQYLFEEAFQIPVQFSITQVLHVSHLPVAILREHIVHLCEVREAASMELQKE